MAYLISFWNMRKGRSTYFATVISYTEKDRDRLIHSYMKDCSSFCSWREISETAAAEKFADGLALRFRLLSNEIEFYDKNLYSFKIPF